MTTSPEPKHGAIRNYRLQTETDPSGYCAVTSSVSEQYCGHCKSWHQVVGVVGSLEFMAHHDSADCVQRSIKKTRSPVLDA